MKTDLTFRFTPKEADKFWEFSLDMRILSKMIEFAIMEKRPPKVKNPNLNNHVRRIQQSCDAIQADAGYALITNKLDYANDHAYSMYRIFNTLRLCEEEELFKIANNLEEQDRQAREIVQAEADAKREMEEA